MKLVREQKKPKFDEMRERARHIALRGNSSFGGVGLSGGMSIMGHMGPIKSFGELQDSILKLNETFDAIALGRFYQ